MQNDGKLAAARAYLSAGNLDLARKHAEAVLRENPGHAEALDVLCAVFTRQNEPDLLERTALDWMARDPAAYGPHFHLMELYINRREAGLARQLIAHYRSQRPGETLHQEFLAAQYEARIENRASGWDRLARAEESRGNTAAALRCRTLAAARRGKVALAIRNGEAARRHGPVNARFLLLLAEIYYRGFRFARCRAAARAALAMQPGLAAPRELIFLSWAVWFPPFLLMHAVNFLAITARGLTGSKQAMRGVYALLMIGMILPISHSATDALAITGLPILSDVRINAVSLFIAMFGFAYYNSRLGAITRMIRGQRRASIELVGY